MTQKSNQNHEVVENETASIENRAADAICNHTNVDPITTVIESEGECHSDSIPQQPLAQAQDDTVDDTPEIQPSAEYVLRSELEQIINDAYLRGRNAAVSAQILADCDSDGILNPNSSSNQNIAPDIAALFEGRKSVWE